MGRRNVATLRWNSRFPPFYFSLTPENDNIPISVQLRTHEHLGWRKLTEIRWIITKIDSIQVENDQLCLNLDGKWPIVAEIDKNCRNFDGKWLKLTKFRLKMNKIGSIWMGNDLKWLKNNWNWLNSCGIWPKLAQFRWKMTRIHSI